MMFKKFWNSNWLGWAAVWFSRFFNYLYVPFGIAVFLWGVCGAGALWAIVGILFAVSGVMSIRSTRKRKHDRKHTSCPQCKKEIKIGVRFCPDCGAEIPVRAARPDNLEEAGEEEAAYNAETMTKKKIGFLVTVGLIVLILVVLLCNGAPLGGGAVYEIQKVSLDNYGPQTMQTLVNENFRGPKWSEESIDRHSAHVYVEGYMPDYAEDVRMEFYYEDQGDGTFQFRLDKVKFLDSHESYSSDDWEMLLFIGMLYNGT